MVKKIILAIVVLVVIMGYYTHYSWSFEIFNNSSNTVYYSFNGKLKNLTSLKPGYHVIIKERGFTGKLFVPSIVILAKEPFVSGQPAPEHTTYEFIAKTIRATIDKDSTFVINQTLPARKLFFGEFYSFCHDGSAFSLSDKTI